MEELISNIDRNIDSNIDRKELRGIKNNVLRMGKAMAIRNSRKSKKFNVMIAPP